MNHRCPDCQCCPSCGRSAWCEGDRILVIPCEHHGYCGECNVENCADCRLEAERDMHASCEYSARSDPFYLGETRQSLDVTAWMADNAARANAAGFDPKTNRHTYPKKDPA